MVSERTMKVDEDKILGVVLGTAIGDALGFQVEFSGMAAIEAEFGRVDDMYPPNGHLYSDDTQMFRAACEGLLRARTWADIDKAAEEVAAEFVAWADGPENNRAPGGACMLGCRNLSRGVPWRESGKMNGGGCGVAMRSMAYGLWFDEPTEAGRWAYEHGGMTHRLPMAQASGAVVAAMVCALRIGYSPREAAALGIAVAAGYDERTADTVQRALHLAGMAREASLEDRQAILRDVLDKWRGWVGYEAVGAAVFCFILSPDNYVEAVLNAVNSPGDSDSIGAITGAFSGAFLGASHIKWTWRDRVEKSEELKVLAERLIKAKKSVS